MALHVFEDHRRSIDPRFITFSKTFDHLKDSEINKIREKVSGDIRRKIEPAWATLGWLDDSEFNVKGKVEFSLNGNLDSKSPTTVQEIKNIYKFNNLLDGEKELVKERYINFDKVDFGLERKEYKVDELPKLRLTVFMNKGEGAIVYYQHSDKGKFKDSENPEESDINADIEYILPQPAETGRDRITYHIPVIPGAVQEIADKPGYIKVLKKAPETSFIVKVLTFKRKVKKDEALIKEAIKNLNVDSLAQQGAHRLFGEKKYKLQKYDASNNTFNEVSVTNKIDFSKKTLLLIHGTFSTIEGSYGATYLSDYSPENVVLQGLIQSGKYEQIIGFDHPTITHGVVQNVQKLYKMLGNNKFSQRVNLMGTSRGALVCKQLANDSNNHHFEVEKVLTFSGANGVGYFTAGDLAVKFLSIWKKTGGPVGKVIAAFAQFSLKRFLQMPGCQVMTPRSTALNAILNANPKNSFTIYQCIGADWHRKLTNIWKRVPAVLLDASLKLILGLKHDWVVNTNNQLIAPDGYRKRSIRFKAIHTKVLDVMYTSQIKRNKNPHTIMDNFF